MKSYILAQCACIYLLTDGICLISRTCIPMVQSSRQLSPHLYMNYLFLTDLDRIGHVCQTIFQKLFNKILLICKIFDQWPFSQKFLLFLVRFSVKNFVREILRAFHKRIRSLFNLKISLTRNSSLATVSNGLIFR